MLEMTGRDFALPSGVVQQGHKKAPSSTHPSKGIIPGAHCGAANLVFVGAQGEYVHDTNMSYRFIFLGI